MNLIPEIKQHNDKLETRIKVLLYGASKVGKSSFASTFPKPLFISTDGNLNHLDNEYGKIEIKVDNNMYTFGNGSTAKLSGKDYLEKIVDELEVKILKNELGFDTIVLDIVDHIYDIFRRHYLKLWNLDDESKYGSYSAGYRIIRDSFYAFMKRIENLNTNIVWISYQNVDMDTGVITPSLTPKVWTNISRLVQIDALLYMNEKTKQREFVFRHNRLGIPHGSALVNPTYQKLKNSIAKEGKKYGHK